MSFSSSSSDSPSLPVVWQDLVHTRPLSTTSSSTTSTPTLQQKRGHPETSPIQRSISLPHIFLYLIGGVGTTAVSFLGGLGLISLSNGVKSSLLLAAYAVALQCLGAWGLHKVGTVLNQRHNYNKHLDNTVKTNKLVHNNNINEQELQALEQKLLWHMLGSFPLVLAWHGAIFLQLAWYQWRMVELQRQENTVSTWDQVLHIMTGRGEGLPWIVWFMPFALCLLTLKWKQVIDSLSRWKSLVWNSTKRRSLPQQLERSLGGEYLGTNSLEHDSCSTTMICRLASIEESDEEEEEEEQEISLEDIESLLIGKRSN